MLTMEYVEREPRVEEGIAYHWSSQSDLVGA